MPRSRQTDRTDRYEDRQTKVDVRVDIIGQRTGQRPILYRETTLLCSSLIIFDLQYVTSVLILQY
jgi:hypothetical protein